MCLLVQKIFLAMAISTCACTEQDGGIHLAFGGRATPWIGVCASLLTMALTGVLGTYGLITAIIITGEQWYLWIFVRREALRSPK